MLSLVYFKTLFSPGAFEGTAHTFEPITHLVNVEFADEREIKIFKS
jgi:hypothetical protein